MNEQGLTREQVEYHCDQIKHGHAEGVRDHADVLLAHDAAQREELSRFVQAVGLATTCAKDMEIDVQNPVGMMQEVCKRFTALHAELEDTKLRRSETVMMCDQLQRELEEVEWYLLECQNESDSRREIIYVRQLAEENKALSGRKP